MSEDRARAAAHRVFGNFLHAQEKFYERSHWMRWDDLEQNLHDFAVTRH